MTSEYAADKVEEAAGGLEGGDPAGAGPRLQLEDRIRRLEDEMRGL